MSRPVVMCVMLTCDRPEMVKRAIHSFRTQTYEDKFLLIWDTTDEIIANPSKWIAGDIFWRKTGAEDKSIGVLRNAANADFGPVPSIICHWDDDDWSEPNRITEQVALLESTGADVVGYSDMLFWQEERQEAYLYNAPPYSCPGTSLCYWRNTWEKKPFGDQPRPGHVTGEDHEWLIEFKLETRPSLQPDPRMIASIHAGNSSGQYANINNSMNWQRIPQFDKLCSTAMKLYIEEPL